MPWQEPFVTPPNAEHVQADYFPCFDWLRLILALTVAVSHSGFIIDPRAANFAVQVFFALSGWLIGGLLLSTERKGLLRFYYNRAARIWIPYYISVAVLFAVSLLKEPITTHWLEYLFYDITFTHNWFITPRIEEIAAQLPLEGTNNHYWSLAVEEQFYLFAPILIVLTKWGRSLWVWATIAAISFGFELWYSPIAFGVAAIIANEQFGNWHLRKESQLALGAVLILCCWAYLVSSDAYAYAAPIASIVIVLLLARGGAKSPIGAFAGGISYPLYLNHWIGIFAMNEILQRWATVSDIGGLLLGVCLNIVIASVLFMSIDKQVHKWRSHNFTYARGRFAASVAYGLVIVGGIGGTAFMFAR